MLTSPSLTSINLSPSGGSGAAFIGEGVDGMWTLTVTDGKKRKTGTPLRRLQAAAIDRAVAEVLQVQDS